MNNTFPIFKPNNSTFVFTKGHFLFLLLIVTLMLNGILNSKSSLLVVFNMLFIPFCLFFMVTKSFRYKKLDGEFDGELIFDKDHLIVNHKKINIEDIIKFYVRTSDYDGLTTGSNRAWQNNKSNGTNNLLDFVTKDKQRTKVFFQMGYMQQEEIKPFIRSLIKLNNIPFKKGSEIESVNEFYRYKKTD